jgi:hypothetical protein
VRVENGGWPELDEVPTNGDVPAGSMHPSVVGGAEQNAIVHFGVTVVTPLPDVVSVAQRGGSVTTWESTSAVSGDECSADTQGHCAHGAADIERFAVASQHHRDDLAVARR